ncbi:sensor histidine kinase [Nocardioides dilutus]
MGPVAVDDVRLLRRLLDQLPALIAYWDRDARNVVANAAYVEWFGFQPAQMHGLHISEVLGAEVYAKNLPFITGALAGEEQLFDRTLVDQSGRVRHTQASYVPDIVDGDVRGFFVLVTDVTPRVEAQRAMDEAQALAKLGSWELDTVTDEIMWSRELFRIIGLEPGPGGRPPSRETLSDYLHPDDRERVLDNVDRATRTGTPYAIDYRLITAAGDTREVVSHGNPVRDHEGRVVRINGTLQDVTEANAAARLLARVNNELRLANELNADVIAMLGHDIRSPLAGLRGFLEILDESWETFGDSERRGIVAKTRAAATRLSEMVDRILALATVDAGRIEPRPEDLDLAETLSLLAQGSGLPSVPTVVVEAEAPSTVSFDPVHFDQIVGNLLTNAFRYGAEPVDVTVTRDEGAVSIVVTDAGPGVPDDLVDTLFTRFPRAGARRAAAGGTGFGLYLAGRLAEANGAGLRYRRPQDDRPHAFVLSVPER